MIVVDSCGWLEYFTNGPNSGFFAPAIEGDAEVIIPAIVIYELWKKISREKSEERANAIVDQLKKLYNIVPLDDSLAIAAARVRGGDY